MYIRFLANKRKVRPIISQKGQNDGSFGLRSPVVSEVVASNRSNKENMPIGMIGDNQIKIFYFSNF